MKAEIKKCNVNNVIVVVVVVVVVAVVIAAVVVAAVVVVVVNEYDNSLLKLCSLSLTRLYWQ